MASCKSKVDVSIQMVYSAEEDAELVSGNTMVLHPVNSLDILKRLTVQNTGMTIGNTTSA